MLKQASDWAQVHQPANSLRLQRKSRPRPLRQRQRKRLRRLPQALKRLLNRSAADGLDRLQAWLLGWDLQRLRRTLASVRSSPTSC